MLKRIMNLFEGKTFSKEEAEELAKELGYTGDMQEFQWGLEIELEHGTVTPDTNITDDDTTDTAKIALAHLNEIPDYYTRLRALEKEAKASTKLDEEYDMKKEVSKQFKSDMKFRDWVLKHPKLADKQYGPGTYKRYKGGVPITDTDYQSEATHAEVPFDTFDKKLSENIKQAISEGERSSMVKLKGYAKPGDMSPEVIDTLLTIDANWGNKPIDSDLLYLINGAKELKYGSIDMAPESDKSGAIDEKTACKFYVEQEDDGSWVVKSNMMGYIGTYTGTYNTEQEARRAIPKFRREFEKPDTGWGGTIDEGILSSAEVDDELIERLAFLCVNRRGTGYASDEMSVNIVNEVLADFNDSIKEKVIQELEKNFKVVGEESAPEPEEPVAEPESTETDKPDFDVTDPEISLSERIMKVPCMNEDGAELDNWRAVYYKKLYEFMSSTYFKIMAIAKGLKSPEQKIEAIIQTSEIADAELRKKIYEK